MTAADYIVLAVIAALFTLALVFCIRKKSRGGCVGCSGNCSECGRKKVLTKPFSFSHKL